MGLGRGQIPPFVAEIEGATPASSWRHAGADEHPYRIGSQSGTCVDARLRGHDVGVDARSKKRDGG
jgi:hypothetical protein